MSLIFSGKQFLFIFLILIFQHYYCIVCRLELISNDSDPIPASFDLRLINISIELFRKFIPIEKATVIFPNNLKNALGNVLLNPVLNTLYPHLHDSILKYVEVRKKYNFYLFSLNTFIFYRHFPQLQMQLL